MKKIILIIGAIISAIMLSGCINRESGQIIKIGLKLSFYYYQFDNILIYRNMLVLGFEMKLEIQDWGKDKLQKSGTTVTYFVKLPRFTNPFGISKARE